MKTFKKGVHPPDRKELARDKAIESLPLFSDYYISTSAHIGAPAKVIVSAGEEVAQGQLIARNEARLGANVYSSVSGVVVGVERRKTAQGGRCEVIHIKQEGDRKVLLPDMPDKSKESILARIDEAGIVGLGGAGFPAAFKDKPNKPCDLLVINGAECEPYLTCDYRLMIEEPQRLIDGLKIVLQLFPEAKGVIGIENNKPEAIRILSELCANEDRIEVATLQAKFPQGSEKHLIKAITGREVPSGALPSAVGCIVDNVDTIIAIERAFLKGRPLMRRIITISGNSAANPGNYKIRLGMTFADLMEQIGGFKEDPAKLIAGGPMMGPSMYTLDVATTKTSSALLCFSKEEAYIPPESNCIRCAKCVGHCPMGLMPYLLNAAALREDGDAFVANHGLDCIECGSCSYICPAKRQLAQSIRATKKIEMGKKAAAAAAAAKK